MTRPSEQPPFKVPLGERVRARRIEQGLTLRALAIRSGLSPRSISRVERGDLGMNIDRFAKLAHALGML